MKNKKERKSKYAVPHYDRVSPRLRYAVRAGLRMMEAPKILKNLIELGMKPLDSYLKTSMPGDTGSLGFGMGERSSDIPESR